MATTYLKNRSELGKYLGIGTRLVVSLIADGLPEIKIGSRKVIYRTDDVDAFMDRYKGGSKQEGRVAKVVSKIMKGI